MAIILVAVFGTGTDKGLGKILNDIFEGIATAVKAPAAE